MKPKKAIHLDARIGCVLEVLQCGLEDLQSFVGGRIERAFTFENGDELFVDEEGTFKAQETAILVEGAYCPLLGSGIVIGKADRHGNDTDAKSTVDEIVNLTAFTSVSYVRECYASGKKLPLIKPELYDTGDE